MARYIDAELMKTKIKNYSKPGDPYYGLDEYLREWIDQQPTANVRENVTGEWNVENGCVCCSVCGEPNMEWNFCPNCGADMRGGKHEQV